jgi:hypothetical protein
VIVEAEARNLLGIPAAGSADRLDRDYQEGPLRDPAS